MGNTYLNIPKKVNDTGWVKITPSSDFDHYKRNLQIRRIGSLVQLRGALAPKSGLLTEDSLGIVCATLDSQYRPKYRVTSINNADGGHRFWLTIGSSGKVYVGRRTNNSSGFDSQIGIGNNFPNVAFLIYLLFLK